MKKLLTIATIICLTALSSFAKEEPNDLKKSKINTALISLPAMNWGSADQVDAKDIETLKIYSVGVQLPAMNWGTPEDIQGFALIAMPDMNWGSPEEVEAEF